MSSTSQSCDIHGEDDGDGDGDGDNNDDVL